ncbi:MAG: hypothetical protein EPN69_01150 [Rhodanobacter sp.]|nr:MAG: hypothetical protein EPN71_13505 [Rhodanobacter sp.]TAL99240.1 MAG: hypothetical protein EPN69_01150 [Rhodanobacter sp.]TAM42273.1 MAG: hypothetical protein EPN58_03525 [Rhodanobacter sp.]
MVTATHSLALDIWMNGVYVGIWERPRGAADRLTYDTGWIRSSAGRPLSLSLPFGHAPSHGSDMQTVRGDKVAAYFENLIPDNERILQRLRDRYGARSTAPYDLLAAIGRDCVGAIQLLPAGTDPGDIRRIEATSLNDAGVAKVLRNTTTSRLPGEAIDDDAFRLSIAGAQEKTALLRHRGRYRRTPLYDVLSTWPIQGRGVNRMDPRKARLAMAVEGNNRHYRIHDIHRWHWVGMAQSLGLGDRATVMIEELIERSPRALDALAKRLPEDFPAALFDSMANGVMAAVKQLAREPDGRSATATRKH